MSIFDFDQRSMLDVYLYETTSLFEQLDTILMHSEQTKTLAEQDIHTMFRIMHTTKSSSSMMNLSQIAELMHRLEDLCALLREHPEQYQDHHGALLSLFFDVSTFMHEQLSIMKEDQYIPGDTTLYLARTKALLDELKQMELPPELIPAPQPEEVDDVGIYIRLKFEEDCRMEHIRAYMIASQLQENCTYLDYYPSTLENNPDAISFIKQHGFYLHVVAQEPQKILERVHHSLFVESCELINEQDYPNNRAIEKASLTAIQEAIPVQPTSMIPVQVQKLDQLQNLTGELMIAESMMIAQLKEGGQKELLQSFEKYFHSIFMDMEEIVMSARLVPISSIVPKLNRVIRDICTKEQKEVTLIVKGDEIELDKEIVDHLFDPLMHLLRNAVDHGIEPKEERLALQKPPHGEILLWVENTNGEIVIHIQDDGRGIHLESIKQKANEKHLLTRPIEAYSDEELLKLILLPGFSTNEGVNEFSGRGVGMDVVKTMTDRFQGHIAIQSNPGHGTHFSLHLPLTLTIVDSVLFRCGSTTFSIPSHNVVRFFSYEENSPNIQREHQHAVYVYKDSVLPLFHLDQFYHSESSCFEEKTILYLRSSTKEACIIVDQILGSQYIVNKPLPALLDINFKKHTGISGCSLLGDGAICMTLNIEYLFNNCLVERNPL